MSETQTSDQKPIEEVIPEEAMQEMEEDLSQLSPGALITDLSKLPQEYRTFINDVVKYLASSGTTIMDTQVICETAQRAALAPIGAPVVLEAALHLTQLFDVMGGKKSLFDTCLALVCLRLRESFNKTQLKDVEFEEV